jgi:hypothetical protein
MSADKPTKEQSAPSAQDRERNAQIETILLARMPLQYFADGVAQHISMPNPAALDAPRSALQVERERLRALPPGELAQLHQRMRAEQEAAQKHRQAAKAADRQDRQAREEAAKFYNLPTAAADFDFWTAHEYWTHEEALALLLGKNPEVVTPARVRRELADAAMIINSGKPVSDFLQAYERLRKLAERASPMVGNKLKPAAVVAWAQSVGVRVPVRLEQLLSPAAPQPEPSRTTAGPDPASQVREETANPDALLKKAALVKKYSRVWTTVESDLAHGSENGLVQAAKAPAHGMWREQAALDWARRNGKLAEAQVGPATLMSGLSGKVHRLGD